MKYYIKKFLFILFALLAILLLLYWFFFGFGVFSQWVRDMQSNLGIRSFFRFDSDAIMAPILYSAIVFPVAIIVAGLFYRKECRIALTLASLLTGIVHTLFGFSISRRIYKITVYEKRSPLGLEILLGIFMLCALLSIVWLVIAMVQYPKKPEKPASMPKS